MKKRGGEHSHKKMEQKSLKLDTLYKKENFRSLVLHLIEVAGTARNVQLKAGINNNQQDKAKRLDYSKLHMSTIKSIAGSSFLGVSPEALVKYLESEHEDRDAALKSLREGGEKDAAWAGNLQGLSQKPRQVVQMIQTMFEVLELDEEEQLEVARYLNPSQEPEEFKDVWHYQSLKELVEDTLKRVGRELWDLAEAAVSCEGMSRPQIEDAAGKLHNRLQLAMSGEIPVDISIVGPLAEVEWFADAERRPWRERLSRRFLQGEPRMLLQRQQGQPTLHVPEPQSGSLRVG